MIKGAAMKNVFLSVFSAFILILAFGSMAEAATPVPAAVPAPAQASPLISYWQGDWAWGDQEAGGSLSIYDCDKDSCSFTLDSGSVASGCSVKGGVQLKSKELASAYDGQNAAASNVCKFDLTVKDSKLDIANATTACQNNCGHKKVDFGAKYEKQASESRDID